MGIVNVLRGLESEKETYCFNGPLRENLGLNWEYCKIFLGSEELDPSYEVQEDDILTIREYPSGTGTGNQGLDIFLGVITGGIYTSIIAYNKAAEIDGKNRIGKSNTQKEIASIPELSGGRNEKAEGKQAPIILGEHLFTPYFLSEPYLQPSGDNGEDLYWYGTLLCGQTGLCFDKIRNGVTDLVSFTGEGVTESKSYPFNEQSPGDDPDNPPPFYDPENKIEIVQEGYFEDGDKNIFNQKWVDSLGSPEELGRKKSKDEEVVNVIFVSDDGPEIIKRETARCPLSAEIEILVDGLCGWDSKYGTATDATVTISLLWSASENGTWRPIEIEGWGDNQSWLRRSTITKKNQKKMRFIASVDFSPFASEVYSKDGKPVWIKAERVTWMHTGGYRDKVYISAIRTRQYNPEKSSPEELVPAKNIDPVLADKFCRMGVKLKVNLNTQEALDKFNIIASMTGRVWDKGKWSDEKVKTSNSAAVALEVLTGLIHDTSRFGFEKDVDWKSFGKLYEYCENQEVYIEGSGRIPVKLEACGVLTAGAKKLDVLRSVLLTCDAGMYMDESWRLIVYFDDTETVPVGLLNPQRIVTMSESRSLARKADGYKVDFIDRESDWSTGSHKILRPRVKKDPGKNTHSPMKLDYITSYKPAMWLVRRNMAKEIHRPGEVKVVVGKEGRYYKPGDLLKVQHERFKIGIGSGEIVANIVEDGMIVGVRTMERFDLSTERDYWIDYYVVTPTKNRVVTKAIRSTGEYTDRLMFTAPIDPAENPYDVPVMGNIVSVIDGEKQGTVTVREARRYKVTGRNEVPDGFELTLGAYSEDIYNAPLNTVDKIPEYHSKIPPYPSKVYTQPESKPVDGKDGSTPYIGDNGNWFIKSEDTGAKAEPRDGEDGEDGENAPRYRGAVTTPDLNNTGKIGGIAFNHLDYVIFTGASGWEYAFIYQWNAVDKKWEKLPREKNWEKYLDAVSDLTEGKADGVFRDVFLKNMFAQTLNGGYANILHELRVGPDGNAVIIDGRDRSVRSEDFVSKNDPQGRPAKGWIIRGNGNVEFNDGIFRGHLDGATGSFSGKVTATEGELDNVTIKETCTVKGKLAAQSLEVTGGHTAGNLGADDAASRLLNPGIVAYDNIRVTSNTVNVPPWGMFTKRIRVVGRGKIRFRVRYKGRCSIWRGTINGGMDDKNTGGTFPLRDALGYVWSDIADLPDDINIFYLTVANSASGEILLENYEFEARSASEPGLLKMFSSPY